MNKYYITIRFKFMLTILVAGLWVLFSCYLAVPWVYDLAGHIGMPLAIFVVFFLAIFPGFMNTFLTFSLMIDSRPPIKKIDKMPGVTILMPCYNERSAVADSIASIKSQDYSGPLEIIIIDDGSTDGTCSVIEAAGGVNLLKSAHGGKATALNRGLSEAAHELIITVDADTHLKSNAVTMIVERLLSDPPGTAGVAGVVLARNSRRNLLTRIQEWDYFHGIASIKRMQSLFQGTLVLQGAFSIFRKDVLKLAGGWKQTMGEDIVLTWNLLKRGYRTGFAENAVSFTTVPETYKSYFNQRRRWARGMLEGFRYNPEVFISGKFFTLFIFWNTLFPLLDAVYLLVFLPGIFLAVFGYYYIAGFMTLLVLPLNLIINGIMFLIQRSMFTSEHLKVRINYFGFLLYLAVYQFVQSPASIAGYIAELLSLRKNWGTK